MGYSDLDPAVHERARGMQLKSRPQGGYTTIGVRRAMAVDQGTLGTTVLRAKYQGSIEAELEKRTDLASETRLRLPVRQRRSANRWKQAKALAAYIYPFYRQCIARFGWSSGARLKQPTRGF